MFFFHFSLYLSFHSLILSSFLSLYFDFVHLLDRPHVNLFHYLKKLWNGRNSFFLCNFFSFLSLSIFLAIFELWKIEHIKMSTFNSIYSLSNGYTRLHGRIKNLDKGVRGGRGEGERQNLKKFSALHD